MVAHPGLVSVPFPRSWCVVVVGRCKPERRPQHPPRLGSATFTEKAEPRQTGGYETTASEAKLNGRVSCARLAQKIKTVWL